MSSLSQRKHPCPSYVGVALTPSTRTTLCLLFSSSAIFFVSLLLLAHGSHTVSSYPPRPELENREPITTRPNHKTKKQNPRSRLVRQATVQFGTAKLQASRRGGYFAAAAAAESTASAVSTASAASTVDGGIITRTDILSRDNFTSSSPAPPRFGTRATSGTSFHAIELDGNGDDVLIEVETMVRAMLGDFKEAGYLQGHPTWTCSPCVSFSMRWRAAYTPVIFFPQTLWHRQYSTYIQCNTRRDRHYCKKSIMLSLLWHYMSRFFKRSCKRVSLHDNRPSRSRASEYYYFPHERTSIVDGQSTHTYVGLAVVRLMLYGCFSIVFSVFFRLLQMKCVRVAHSLMVQPGQHV